MIKIVQKGASCHHISWQNPGVSGVINESHVELESKVRGKCKWGYIIRHILYRGGVDKEKEVIVSNGLAEEVLEESKEAPFSRPWLGRWR